MTAGDGEPLVGPETDAILGTQNQGQPVPMNRAERRAQAHGKKSGGSNKTASHTNGAQGANSRTHGFGGQNSLPRTGNK